MPSSAATPDRIDMWLSAPWCTTEFYAYRRLMEAVGYFEVAAANHRWDVFRPQKRAGLEGSPPPPSPSSDGARRFPPTRTPCGATRWT